MNDGMCMRETWDYVSSAQPLSPNSWEISFVQFLCGDSRTASVSSKGSGFRV